MNCTSVMTGCVRVTEAVAKNVTAVAAKREESRIKGQQSGYDLSPFFTSRLARWSAILTLDRPIHAMALMPKS
jgi:hypothetical protein